MDERAGEQLFLMLCRRSTGDVHLDLAEMDSIDIMDLIALLRGAATLPDGRHLVLHNPPSALRLMLDAVGDSVAVSTVLVD